MPNWTTNQMTVHADEGHIDELKRFVEMITIPEDMRDEDAWEVQKYSLIRLMPMPTVLEGTISPVPDSPEPHPNWANLLAKGEITQEWHDELVQNNIDRYNEGVRVKAETGYSSWYEWQHANWGIKWGDCRTGVSEGAHDGMIHVDYETPWAPFGEGFMTHVSTLFPNLTFAIRMTEEAWFFAGVDVWKNGDMVSEMVDIDTIVDSVGEDVDDDIRYEVIYERIMDAVESAATSLGV